MPERPSVSVVIPTHDRQELLPRTVASALAQQDVEVEVIVVDDVSEARPERLAGGDPRVRLISLPEPTGVAAARNAGIAAAAGDWVALLDDDDLWGPGKLRDQVAAAERTGADWVYSAVVLVDGELQGLEALPAPD